MGFPFVVPFLRSQHVVSDVRADLMIQQMFVLLRFSAVSWPLTRLTMFFVCDAVGVLHGLIA